MVTAEAPQPITDYAPRCKSCGNVLIHYTTRPWMMDCYHRVNKDGKSRRCKVRNSSDALGDAGDATAR